MYRVIDLMKTGKNIERLMVEHGLTAREKYMNRHHDENHGA